MTKKILIIHREADFFAQALRKRCPGAVIVPIEEDAIGSSDIPELAYQHIADADAIISIARWINADFVDACPRLKWFQCLITGTDHLNDLLRGRDVILTNGRGIHGSQMAEIAVLHMMAHLRQVPRLVASQAAHAWDQVLPRVLKGRTATILGVGAIGEDVARLLKAFGMTTIGVSRTPRQVDGFDRIEPRERMRVAVGEADFVIVLLPLTPENRNAVDAEVIAAMKPEAGLINIGRGGTVDEDALIDALRAGRIAFAGLDVFHTTPLPPDSPFWDMENVFLTPHIGGRSDRYDEDALSFVIPNAEHFVSGRIDQMINVVPL
jgi:D-2-hydroxyacid dehydrogenase (NADP+)